MSVPPPLPVELFIEIFLYLRHDRSVLKQCALVCSTFRVIVQQHLFAQLTLHRFPYPSDETACSRLVKPEHSHLLSLVRHLKLQCYPPPGKSVPDPSFEPALRCIPTDKLTTITIHRRYRDDPLPDTEALVQDLLRKSTALRVLNLEDRRVPASYLNASSASLKVLRIQGTEFVEDETPTHLWATLDSLLFPLRMLSECLMWMVLGSMKKTETSLFPRLKHLLIADEVKEVEIVNQVLDICKSTLRSFVYTPYGYNFSSFPHPCLNQNGNIIEFTIPTSLRILAINCPIILKPTSTSSANPFGWLSYTFRQSSHEPCSLEIVHIKFLTTAQIENLDSIFPGGFPIDVYFHEFDQLLSSEARFPYLRKVYLTVGRHYLGLFADHHTLPLLNQRGLLGVIYEEVSGYGVNEERRYWEYHGSRSLMTGVEEHPWDGRTSYLV